MLLAQVRESRECQTEEGLEWPGELDLGLLDQIDPSALLGSGSGAGPAVDPLQLAALYSTAAGVWSDTASASASALGPALDSYSAALGRPAAPALGAASAFEANMDSYEPVYEFIHMLNNLEFMQNLFSFAANFGVSTTRQTAIDDLLEFFWVF